jgi:sugar (pentulose or hexulose) kinase
VTMRRRTWVGIDVGKTSHHACAIDETGKVVWNQKVSNEHEPPRRVRRLMCPGFGGVAILGSGHGLGGLV